MQNINIIKYVLLMLVIGITLAVFVFLLNLLLEMLSISLPHFVLGGGVVGAGMVVAMVTINKALRDGRFKWLLKN